MAVLSAVGLEEGTGVDGEGLAFEQAVSDSACTPLSVATCSSSIITGCGVGVGSTIGSAEDAGDGTTDGSVDGSVANTV